MKFVGKFGASCVAYAVLLSVQSGAVASTIEAEQAPTSSAAAVSGGAWSTDLKFGRYKSAINQLDSVVRSGKLDDEQHAVALINRGLARQKLKQYKQAVADYTAALKVDALAPKTRAVVVYNRGIAHQKLKRQALAIEDFTNALYLDVEFAHAYYARGRLMQEVGRHEFALADFKMAMKYNHPSPHLPFYGQALAYQSTQQNAKARKSLSRALLLKPDFRPALERYAKLTGRPFRSHGTAQPANKIKPVLAKRGSSASALNQANATQVKAVAGEGNLPKAVAPTTAMLSAAGRAEKFVAADPIVTGSVSKEVRTATNVASAKLPFRYPGMVGATKPVPAMTPRMALTDLRPQAEKTVQDERGLAQRDEQTNPETVTGQAAETAADNSARTRVAYLGNASNIGLGQADAAPTAENTAPVSNEPEVTETFQEPPKGWYIQLNAQRSQDAAKSVWQKYLTKHGRALKGTNVVYQRADLGDKGIYWRVRLGTYEGRRSAERKCRRLKRSGLRCFVVKSG